MGAIAYQNKDIVSKLFAENLKDKSLAVYGLDIPKVQRVLPTNLPEIEANELRIDNLFLLEDGSVAIIDYESTYTVDDKLKYLGYLTRVLRRYQREGFPFPKLRMIVIYTADIEKAEAVFDVGSLKMTIETAFLVHLDTDEIRRKLTEKIERCEDFTDDELMELIILPLTCKGKEEKQETLKEAVELAKKIKDESVQLFALTGIITFSDKIIDDVFSKKVRSWLKMTKIGKLYESEKLEALREKEAVISEKEAVINEKEAEISEKEAVINKKEAVISEKEAEISEKKAEISEKEALLSKVEREKKQALIQTAQNLMKRGFSAQETIAVVTALTMDDVLEIERQIKNVS